MAVNRKAFDEAVAAMTMDISPFFKDYVFYTHMVAQCKIIFTENLPAAAGVNFKNDHYNLYLNPLEVLGIDKEGKEILGFCEKMPIEQRIGILKHEMLHLALGHLIRKEDKDHQKFNFASDCALNQEIERTHLPDYAIYPDNFPTKEPKILWKESAEYYYELIDDEQMPKEEEGGSGGKGSSNPMTGTSIGDHGIWEESEGDTELQQELTKNMIERAAKEAQKLRGNLPQSYSEMLENLTIKREVDWKQILRRLVGNKKANQRKTLLRRDRRLPHANWIKGRTKDRIFDLGVISDVSGSVSDTALLALWGEIIHICELYDTPVQLVQVDTESSDPEPLTKRSKLIERKAYGGTYLSPAIKKLQEAKVKFDALVVTTDGYLSNEDVENFKDIGKPVIWLIEKEGQIMPNMEEGRMRAIQLKEN